jgi:ATP-dependent DNA ligase
VRKINADDTRQAAELIELDGGDLRCEPLDTRKATLASLLQ